MPILTRSAVYFPNQNQFVSSAHCSLWPLSFRQHAQTLGPWPAVPWLIWVACGFSYVRVMGTALGCVAGLKVSSLRRESSGRQRQWAGASCGHWLFVCKWLERVSGVGRWRGGWLWFAKLWWCYWLVGVRFGGLSWSRDWSRFSGRFQGYVLGALLLGYILKVTFSFELWLLCGRLDFLSRRVWPLAWIRFHLNTSSIALCYAVFARLRLNRHRKLSAHTSRRSSVVPF